MPKISVIVPVYKVEKYIYRCVDSILNQTFTDFECIFVDDGSPDNCGKICDEYAKKDKRVKVIHKQNGGLSDARNAGLDIAQGEYIYFLDSDDYVECNLLEKLYDTICVSNAEMIVFGYKIEYENSTIYRDAKFLPLEYKLEAESDYLNFICKILLPYKVGWEAWDKVFKASVIKENGLKFYDNAKIYAEDLHFSICYLLNIKKIKVLDDVLYHYTDRETSITGSNKSTKINEYVKLNLVLYKYLKTKKYHFLISKFYMIFYVIMNNRYLQSDYDDVLRDISRVEDKEFLRRNLLKIIFNSKKMAVYFNTSQKSILFENMKYILNTSNIILFKILRNICNCLRRDNK